MAYLPKRGDIVWTNFNPSAGREQARKRPAIVLSPETFNRRFKLALVAPITSRVRGHGFEVKLEATKIQGAILSQQIKIIDYEHRGIQFIETAPAAVINDVLAKVRVLVS